jgi:hypothetical protein
MRDTARRQFYNCELYEILCISATSQNMSLVHVFFFFLSFFSFNFSDDLPLVPIFLTGSTGPTLAQSSFIPFYGI